MLKVFQRIRRKLLEEGKLRNYLIYAFGEIFLIVVGILIALQINNWNEAKKENAKLQMNILSIAEDVKTDLASINRALLRFKRQEKSGEILIPILESNEKKISDSLSFILAFNDMTYSATADKKTVTWDMLNSSGVLSEFPDTMLLNLLKDYYNSYNSITTNYMESGHPARLELRRLKYELFTQTDHRKFFPTETPEAPSGHAFQRLFEDERVLPLCRFISSNSTYFIRSYESAKRKAEEIVRYIDNN